MKSAFVLAALSTVAAAQSVFFAAPAPHTTVSPGDKFVVDIERVDNLILSTDVSVAIGLLSCPGGTDGCTDIDGLSSSSIGTVLFSGPYAPHTTPGQIGFSQNFTVEVPEAFAAGPALLSVAHFFLLGSSVSDALHFLVAIR
ncbi:hypothetical protein C8Q77DRAFT_1218871 [Trametes polyzona]|nr:hypothetical protein C8Q77DRAFT_1218871 [Trametes polyzona]